MKATDLMFRALQAQDAPAVGRLMSEHPLWGDRDHEEHSRRIAHLLDRGEYGLIAEYVQDDDRALAGFTLMSDSTFGDHGYIRLFGIQQGLTGQGIGTRLLHMVEGLFAQRQIQRVFLLCTDWNTAAQAFYEHHGYERVGVLPDWLKGGIDELIYVKRDLDDQERRPGSKRP